MKFYQLLKENKVTIDQINDYINEWYTSESPENIYEFLGLNEAEFRNWLKTNCLN